MFSFSFYMNNLNLQEIISKPLLIKLKTIMLVLDLILNQLISMVVNIKVNSFSFKTSQNQKGILTSIALPKTHFFTFKMKSK